MILLAVGCDAFFPRVVGEIGQFQAALYLLQADAVTTVVGGGLGEVGVADVAGNLIVVGIDADMDERRLGRADTMLEGILDQRNEKQGRHLY